MFKEENLLPGVQELLKKVRSQLDGELTIEVGDEKDDLLDPENSETKETKNGYLITIPNPNFVDFAVAHELLHLRQFLLGTVQFGLALPLRDGRLNEPIGQIGNFLGNAVMHRSMIPVLKEMGVLPVTTQRAILQKITATLPDEANKNSPFMHLSRAMQLVDTLAFVPEVEETKAAWEAHFPLALQAAQPIFDALNETEFKTNRDLRYGIVTTFHEFTQFYQNMGLQLPSLQQTMVVTPVLSTRQLDHQTMNQRFQLWHDDDLFAVNTTDRAFVGINSNDDQASFTIKLKTKAINNETMLGLYNMTTRDFLDQFKIHYSMRDDEII